MASVFSKRFLVQKGLSGAGASVTVPAGHTYIIKQLTVYGNATIADINAFLEDDATGAALFDGLIPAGKNGWAGFYGAIVCEAGDAFHFNVTSTAGDAADVFASGYDLTS